MARKQTTKLTYEVSFDLPTGLSVQEFTNCLYTWLNGPDKSENLVNASAKLVKKETTYE